MRLASEMGVASEFWCPHNSSASFKLVGVGETRE